MDDVNKLKPMGIQSKETMDAAANKTKDALGKAQGAVDGAAETLATKVESIRGQVKPALDDAGSAASDALDQAVAVMRDVADQLKVQAQRAADAATSYTKDEPIKAMLMAAAAGALAMGLLTLMVRSDD